MHPRELAPARLELHWAVQPIAAVGNTLVPARTDFSHTALDWVPSLASLVGQPLENGSRFGVRVASIELIHLEGNVIDRTLGLNGKTLAEAESWIGDLLPVGSPKLEQPDYGAEGMPAAPVGIGAPYTVTNKTAHEELGRWFSNGHAVLEALAQSETGASPVLCWPHHFDIATLVTFDPGEPDAEKARSIGLGLSPGDGSVDEPYFYVGPWPRPNIDTLPALDGEGQWQAWGGAVLPASHVVPKRSAADQAAQVLAFFRSGIAASKSALGL